jgi:hypothetical protein
MSFVSDRVAEFRRRLPKARIVGVDVTDEALWTVLVTSQDNQRMRDGHSKYFISDVVDMWRCKPDDARGFTLFLFVHKVRMQTVAYIRTRTEMKNITDNAIVKLVMEE